jgi:penicillin-binding protein 2
VIEPPLQRRLPLPPQLTRRVGALGVLAFALLAIVTFRLWYLQVLTGPQNVSAATANVDRAIPLPAPRGSILDSAGNPFAATQVEEQAAIIADDLPPAHSKARWQEYVRLGKLLGVTAGYIWGIIYHDNNPETPGYQPAAIKDNIGRRTLVVLSEQERSFPGVVEQAVPVRDYTQGGVGGAVLGSIGPISLKELSSSAFKGIAAGTYVGQSGLEAQYNRYLQGRAGVEDVKVDAAGYPTGAAPKVTQAVVPGDNLKTSLSLAVEQEGYNALKHAMRVAQHNGDPAPAGAFFAMDPDTGRVIALGSMPTYDPSMFVTPPSTSQYNALLAPAAHQPLDDRAIDGTYPVGSTFKPITALAGLQNGLITATTLQGAATSSQNGVPCVQISTECLHNSGGVNLGDLDLVQALTQSEDTYIYHVGAAANGAYGTGLAIQDEARRLGLGSSLGIDLGDGGQPGLVPDRAVINNLNDEYISSHCQTGTTRPLHRYATEELAITACSQGYFYAPWTVGQNVGLATGQGQLEASPMQMAVAYSAIANGGTVWRPQVGEAIDSPSGQLAEELPPPAAIRHITIDPTYRSLVLQGLHDAAQTPAGTSYPTFGSFPMTVYGKTGTAEHYHQADQSWYVAYVPDGSRSIVVAVTIEQAGFGAAAAAPAARLILSQWFGLPKKWLAGTSTTL